MLEVSSNNEGDKQKKIAGFGDGPASFNYEAGKQGKSEKRYIYHELPERLPYAGKTFDIGLSSHFLLMYTSLGYDFHIQAMEEMLRVCKEIRIFPIVDLDANHTSLIMDVIKYFKKYYYEVKILKTKYEFQKGGNKLLVIR